MREPTIGLTAAAKLVRVHPATLYAWRKQGVLMPCDDPYRFTHAQIVDARAVALLASQGRSFEHMAETRAAAADIQATLAECVESAVRLGALGGDDFPSATKARKEKELP